MGEQQSTTTTKLQKIVARSQAPDNRRRLILPNLLWLMRNHNLIGLSDGDKKEMLSLINELITE